MARLCTICARGGSKAVPGKNLRLIAGKPLIAHTVRQAIASARFDVIAVSSDSPEILRAGIEAGASLAIDRPPELATDTAGKVPAIAHCLMEAEKRLEHSFEILVDLSVTAPLRSIEDIRGAITLLEGSDCTNVITGTLAKNSPYFSLVEADVAGFVHLSKPSVILRRQDSPPCFDMNGSIYVWQRDRFLASPAVFYPDTRLLEMPPERSLDIDTELDFEIVKFLMERH